MLLLVFSHNLISASKLNQQGVPVNEIQNSHISRGFGLSNGGSFSVTSSIAETVIGTSSNNGFIVHSGLLKPSAVIELIFINSFE
jgi:hypothetical protein